MNAVTSWRDSATQQAQDDLDGLLDASLPFAQEMLDKHGEFFPYALAVSGSGETMQMAGEPGEGEQPSSVAVLQILVEGLRAERDTLRAAAIVSDVRLSDSDAIRVELELWLNRILGGRLWSARPQDRRSSEQATRPETL